MNDKTRGLSPTSTDLRKQEERQGLFDSRSSILTYAFYKMVVSSVHLVLPLWPSGVRNAGTEAVRKLPHQVIIESVLERAKNDDRPREFQVDLLNRLVG